MSVHRMVGTETEFGVLEPGNIWANPVHMSTAVVAAYAEQTRVGTPVKWDYAGEDPLNDLRGYRILRSAADPSQLTDDPTKMAPSGGVEELERPAHNERALLQATNVVLPNGARFYVDHAHPEYSGPETETAQQAVLYDRAGEVVAQRAMELLWSRDEKIVLYKNNTDGKGSSYGSHDNFLVKREVALSELIGGLTPFLVTRQILCGAGRVGIGQRSEQAGFQISQRADYIENDVGLETTFNRPIINTRDEPHADSLKWRRLHLIGGDANLFDISTLLRIGTTSLVLAVMETGIPAVWSDLELADPVAEMSLVSHDVTLKHKLTTVTGDKLSAIEMQRRYLDSVGSALSALGTIDAQTQEVLDMWSLVLDGLETDPTLVADKVEWVAKYQLLSRQRERLNAEWSDPRLKAFDLQWADLRPGKSLVAKLDAAGRVHRIWSTAEVEKAAEVAPANTRAGIRGAAVNLPEVVAASWERVVVDLPEEKTLLRIRLPEPYQGASELLTQLLNGNVRALFSK